MISSNPRKFSLKEVAEFNGKDGKPAYLIYRGVVYDVTNYLERHPGGKKILFEYAGRDCTKDFDDMDHSNEAFSEMNKLKIGEVEYPTKMLQQNESFASIISTESERRKKRRFLLCR